MKIQEWKRTTSLHIMHVSNEYQIWIFHVSFRFSEILSTTTWHLFDFEFVLEQFWITRKCILISTYTWLHRWITQITNTTTIQQILYDNSSFMLKTNSEFTTWTQQRRHRKSRTHNYFFVINDDETEICNVELKSFETTSFKTRTWTKRFKRSNNNRIKLDLLKVNAVPTADLKSQLPFPQNFCSQLLLLPRLPRW